MGTESFGPLMVLFWPVAVLVLFFGIGRAVERRHVRRMDTREQLCPDVLCLNLRTLPPGWQATEPVLVAAQVVVASDAFKSWAAGLRNIFGGEIRSFERLLLRARREAVLQLKEQARAQGKNVVWNLRFERSTVTGNDRTPSFPAAEVLAYATMARVERMP